MRLPPVRLLFFAIGVIIVLQVFFVHRLEAQRHDAAQALLVPSPPPPPSPPPKIPSTRVLQRHVPCTEFADLDAAHEKCFPSAAPPQRIHCPRAAKMEKACNERPALVEGGGPAAARRRGGHGPGW